MEQKNNLIEFWKENFDFGEPELDAFQELDRTNFIPKNLKENAYDDTPLPLLRGKTISQPTTVMIMTAALKLELDEKIFEIGTGSGYQAAIIAKIVGPKGKVISTETIPELVKFSKENLNNCNINNVEVYEEEGSKGMPNKAPFDKIIITAACKKFPQELIDQLKTNGIIIAPVGDRHEQELQRGIKHESGVLEIESLGQFIFTPMYGKYGFEV